MHLFGAYSRSRSLVPSSSMGRKSVKTPFVQPQQDTDEVVQIVADHPQAVQIVAADAEEDARGVGRFVR